MADYTQEQLSEQRTKINEHPYSVAMVYLDQPVGDLSILITDVDFEWFDNEDAADEYVGDLRAFAVKETEDDGTCKLAVMKILTGSTLTVQTLEVFGFQSDVFKKVTQETLTVNIEEVLFQNQIVEVTLAAKLPRKQAIKKSKAVAVAKVADVVQAILDPDTAPRAIRPKKDAFIPLKKSAKAGKVPTAAKGVKAQTSGAIVSSGKRRVPNGPSVEATDSIKPIVRSRGVRKAQAAS